MILVGVLFFVLMVEPDIRYYYTDFPLFFVVLINTFFGVTIPLFFIMPIKGESK